MEAVVVDAGSEPLKVDFTVSEQAPSMIAEREDTWLQTLKNHGQRLGQEHDSNMECSKYLVEVALNFTSYYCFKENAS